MRMSHSTYTHTAWRQRDLGPCPWEDMGGDDYGLMLGSLSTRGAEAAALTVTVTVTDLPASSPSQSIVLTSPQGLSRSPVYLSTSMHACKCKSQESFVR